MNRQCHQKQTKQKLCNGFCAFFKSMYVNPDNRKKKEKKSLYTTKTLLKNQRQHLGVGWVFCLLSRFAFLPPLLSSSGKVSPAHPWVHGAWAGGRGALLEQGEFNYHLPM